MMIIVYTSPQIARDLSLDALSVGNLIGAIFVGMGIGSLIWSFICDRLGRKMTIISSLVLYGLISLLSVLSPDYYSLYVSRLLSGVAAAGMLIVTFPYFEELLPVRWRGPFTVYLAAGWPVGILCALGATVFLEQLGWRWIIGVSSLASLWAIVVTFLVPESPYWLAAVGRQSAARETIHRLSGGQVVVPPGSLLHVDTAERGMWRELVSGRMLPLTITQITLNFTFSWGYWGLQTWLPTLLQQRGLSVSQSYSFIAISALCMIPGYISASFLTGSYGRKKVLIWYIVAAALSGYAFANAETMSVVYASNFALSFFSLGAWGIWDTWIAEFYPTRVRTVGYSAAIFAQRVANIAAPTVIGALVAHGISFNVTTTIINLFMVASVVLAFFLPETEGKDLE
ncbi:MFS transporter [Methylobacterium sp. J-077]|nr:MFS transporter [Methylobacterium sp. J-077]